MIDSEILKELDTWADRRADGHQVLSEAAALIRRLQAMVLCQDQEIDALEGQLKFALNQVRVLFEGREVETIRDRDARAALAWLLAHPKPQGMTSTITSLAWVLADAMAEERAKRKESE